MLLFLSQTAIAHWLKKWYNKTVSWAFYKPALDELSSGEVNG